jgi:hypothetical protein
MQTQKKARNGGVDQQVSMETKDGMNERDLKLKVMEQQVGVEDVGLGLALSEIVEEVDLDKTILMIKEQENVVHVVLMSEQEYANEDVEPHAHIDGGDILNFVYYNLLPHPSSQVERMGGVFLGQICDYNTFFNYGL